MQYLRFTVGLVLTLMALEVAEAQQAPPAAINSFNRVLRNTKGNVGAARRAALETWIEEVEAGRVLPSPSLNLEIQRQFGPNARQYELAAPPQQLDPLPQHQGKGRGEINQPNPAASATSCLGKSLEDCRRMFGQPTQVDSSAKSVAFTNADGSTTRCFFSTLTPNAACDGVLFEPVEKDGQLVDLLKQNSQGKQWGDPKQRANEFEQYLRWERSDGAVATFHEEGFLIINSPGRARAMGL